jgi:hypothetical protein
MPHFRNRSANATGIEHTLPLIDHFCLIPCSRQVLKLAVFSILCENSTARNDRSRRAETGNFATQEPDIRRKPRMRPTTGKPTEIDKLEIVGGTPFMLRLASNASPGTL